MLLITQMLLMLLNTLQRFLVAGSLDPNFIFIFWGWVALLLRINVFLVLLILWKCVRSSSTRWINTEIKKENFKTFSIFKRIWIKLTRSLRWSDQKPPPLYIQHHQIFECFIKNALVWWVS
jgi:hypothetical protein